MAIPTIVGVSASAASGSANTITPAYPTSYTAVANDVAITYVETESETITPPTNWAIVTSSVVSTGTVSRLTAIWRRLTAGESAPAISTTSNHMVGRMIVVRGCTATGNPWDVFLPDTELVADTSISITGVTTTVADCLVLVACGTGQDVASTAGVSGWANANLSGLTEQMDNWVTAGLGGGFAVAAGGKATVGATGATTATLALTANFKTLMTIALRPAIVIPEPPGQLMRSPRPSETHTVVGAFAPSTQSYITGG